MHEPVLLEEVLRFAPANPQLLVDCTLGLGGHAQALLQCFPQAQLFGSDRDSAALAHAAERLSAHRERILLRPLRFSELPHHLMAASVDYLLADLGISSWQIAQAERGFSFSREGPLDMRMNPNQGRSAETLLNTLPVAELERLLREFGEETFARRIAQAIGRRRAEAPLRSTVELAKIVQKAIPVRSQRHGLHPATRTFQALRIAVNDELGQLETLLTQAPDLLRPGGRIAVIAFHSLEDRLVKSRFLRWEKPCVCPPDFPLCACGERPKGHALLPRLTRPTLVELQRNPRSRSARLRVFVWQPEVLSA